MLEILSNNFYLRFAGPFKLSFWVKTGSVYLYLLKRIRVKLWRCIFDYQMVYFHQPSIFSHSFEIHLIMQLFLLSLVEIRAFNRLLFLYVFDTYFGITAANGRVSFFSILWIWAGIIITLLVCKLQLQPQWVCCILYYMEIFICVCEKKAKSQLIMSINNLFHLFCDLLVLSVFLLNRAL